jgi:hypothetical protein
MTDDGSPHERTNATNLHCTCLFGSGSDRVGLGADRRPVRSSYPSSPLFSLSLSRRRTTRRVRSLLRRAGTSVLLLQKASMLDGTDGRNGCRRTTTTTTTTRRRRKSREQRNLQVAATRRRRKGGAEEGNGAGTTDPGGAGVRTVSGCRCTAGGFLSAVRNSINFKVPDSGYYFTVSAVVFVSSILGEVPRQAVRDSQSQGRNGTPLAAFHGFLLFRADYPMLTWPSFTVIRPRVTCTTTNPNVRRQGSVDGRCKHNYLPCGRTRHPKPREPLLRKMLPSSEEGSGGRRSTARREGHVSSTRHHRPLMDWRRHTTWSVNLLRSGPRNGLRHNERTGRRVFLATNRKGPARSNVGTAAFRSPARPLPVHALAPRSSSELLAVLTLMGTTALREVRVFVLRRSCPPPATAMARPEEVLAAASSSLRDLVARTRQGRDK